jgi:two-component system, NtrC family, response regulator AtoC
MSSHATLERPHMARDEPAAPARVFVVEDDASLRRLLCEELGDLGYDSPGFASAEDALVALRQPPPPDLVVCDLRLPGMDGMSLLRRFQQDADRPAFLIVTAFGSVGEAVAALKAGADDFLTKPLDLDHLALTVNRLLEARRLRAQVQAYQSLIDDAQFAGLLGRSPVMRALYEQIRQIAVTDAPALIAGESGTGKELIARALHSEGPRRAAPFVAINCASIPQELIESELFGHEAGAFTGATRKQPGLFRAADGGTLLLDEIGEMPLPMQAKLLRVLQEGSIRPVGATREIDVNTRILAASNRELEVEVQAGSFREDLFFRLETFSLRAPPLRERGDDLAFLAAAFLRLHSDRLNKRIAGFADDAMAALQTYSFPGNVRELQNAVERAATFCDGAWVGARHLPPRIRDSKREGADICDSDTGRSALPDGMFTGPVLPTLAEVEQRYIRHVLEHTHGNKRRAAALLGIGRRTLYRKIGLDDSEP